ncbi:MAG: hypothetical protein JEY91_02145 [Spirochaetaceae bacterium]|nr:hypothetical protein [Spirochaetaceae bacterium]
MTLIKRIKETYKDEEYKIQMKAPILAILSLFIATMLIPLTILYIITKEPPVRIIMDILMIVSVLSSFILVLKGKYTRAATVLLSSIFIILSLLYISQSFMVNQIIHSNALSFYELMFITILFTNSRKQALFFSISSLAMFLVSSIIALLTGHIYTEIMPPITQILIPAILMTVAIITIYFTKTIEGKILTDILEKLKQSKDDEIKRKELLASSAKQLEKTNNVSLIAENAIRASSSIKNSLETVTDQINILQQSFNSSAKALNQINTSVDNLKSLSDDQASNVTESSASIEEMSASIENVSSVIHKKKETVSALKSISTKGEDTLENTIDSFESVSKHLESIKEMTSIIESIASQTNLLSMNAAIESAHAGDAGKGFAVVAEEIRKLADSSSQNAGEIAVTLRSLVEAIEKAGVEINESGTAFKEMHSHIEEVSQAMDEMSSNTSELSIGSKEILTASTNLNELTQNVNSSVNDVQENQQVVYSDINDVLGSADAVLRSVTDMMQNIGEISEEVLEIKSSIDVLIEHSKLLNKEIET